MKTRLISLVCLLSLALSGCGTSPTPVSEASDLPSLNPQEIPTQQLPDSPTQGDTTPMSTQLPTPADSYLQSLIEKAKEDLAQRFSISITQINLIEAMAVEWSDSSLGCPQPDMFYLQVITPGYRILLEANSQVYEYHSNRATYIVLCENPSALISPPKP